LRSAREQLSTGLDCHGRAAIEVKHRAALQAHAIAIMDGNERRVTVAMVAPFGPHRSASTHACFESTRPVG
jgi:hypothetical protein